MCKSMLANSCHITNTTDGPPKPLPSLSYSACFLPILLGLYPGKQTEGLGI